MATEVGTEAGTGRGVATVEMSGIVLTDPSFIAFASVPRGGCIELPHLANYNMFCTSHVRLLTLLYHHYASVFHCVLSAFMSCDLPWLWQTQVAWYAVLHHVGGGVPAMTGEGAVAPAPTGQLTGAGGAPPLPLGVGPAALLHDVAAAPLLSDALTGKYTTRALCTATGVHRGPCVTLSMCGTDGCRACGQDVRFLLCYAAGDVTDQRAQQVAGHCLLFARAPQPVAGPETGMPEAVHLPCVGAFLNAAAGPISGCPLHIDVKYPDK